MTFKYTVFLDGTIAHYMEGDEFIKEAKVFNTLPEAKAKAVDILKEYCEQRIAALSKIKSKEVE